MSQNISLWGASYSNVPSVTLPKTGGGTASFTDVTDTTATASDVASGKYFYTAAGVKTQGTSTSGGYITQDANGYVVLSSTNGVPTLKTKSITANGTYNASSDNASGYSNVSVNVSPNLTTKSITANGTYNASSDSADGYSSVTVNVQSTPQLSTKYGTGSRVYVSGKYKWRLTFSGFSAAPSMFFLKLNTGLEMYGYSYSPLYASASGTDYLYMVIDGVYMQGTSQFFGKASVTGDYHGEYALLENNGNSCITWSYSGGTLTFTCQSTFNNNELCFASNNSSTGDYILYYA